MYFGTNLGGYGRPLAFSLGDLNPVVGWYLNGASNVFLQYHVLVAMPKCEIRIRFRFYCMSNVVCLKHCMRHQICHYNMIVSEVCLYILKPH